MTSLKDTMTQSSDTFIGSCETTAKPGYNLYIGSDGTRHAVRNPWSKTVMKGSSPDHYAKGRRIQPIDVIEDWGLDFCLGNAVKYIARAGRKVGDTEEDDLNKAVWYIRRYLERCK